MVLHTGADHHGASREHSTVILVGRTCTPGCEAQRQFATVEFQQYVEHQRAGWCSDNARWTLGKKADIPAMRPAHFSMLHRVSEKIAGEFAYRPPRDGI